METIKAAFAYMLVLTFGLGWLVSLPLGLYVVYIEMSEGPLVFVINMVLAFAPWGGLINFLFFTL